MRTNNEKEMIRELRLQGLGYGKEHPYMIDRKAYYDFTCPNCGKEFRIHTIIL